ncbi:MAG TPA: YbhN family protein [Actinomycetota bacterium]|nr:YbhN family protein [Actinomycetota bacterium]
MGVGVAAFSQRHLFEGFASIVTRLTWYWVGLAFIVEMGSVPPLAEAELIVLRAGGVHADRWRMNLVTLASNAIAMSIPAGVAVAEGYTYSRYRQLGAEPAAAAWAELASGALAFAALAAVALAGGVLAGGPDSTVLVPTLAVVTVGSVGAAALFRHPHLLAAGLGWVERTFGRDRGSLVARTTQRIGRTAGQLSFPHPDVATWLTAFGLSLANWLMDVAALAFAFLAAGGHVPWGVVLLAFAGAKVVSSIGITPGGLGIVEGGMVATFVAYGVQGPTAVAAVLVYRGLTYLGLVGIGWAAVGLLSLQRGRRG